MTEESAVPALNVQVELHDLRRELSVMRRSHTEELSMLRGDIKGLVEAWETARGLVKFVKLIGALSLAIAGVIALVKTGWSKS